MEPSERDSTTARAREAARWILATEDELAPLDREKFVAWLKSSPRHPREFLFFSAIMQELKTFKVTLNPRDLLQRHGNVLQWPGREPALPPQPADTTVGAPLSRPKPLLAAAAAFMAIAIAGLVGWHMMVGVQQLSTAIGEQRALRLSDGTVVHVNTNTHLIVKFTRHAREVRLLKGEALFTVEPDRDRPFRVHTDSATLQAIGTQFNVYRRERSQAETIVSVLQGHVALLAKPAREPLPETASDVHYGRRRELGHRQIGVLAVLSAGQQARVPRKGPFEKRTLENALDVAAWRERQLVFYATTLAEVAAELGRYTQTPVLHIEDAPLREQKITAAFPVDDVESLLQFIARSPEIVVTRTADRVEVRRAAH